MARAVRARPTDAPREAPVGSARGSEIVLTGRCPLRARCHSTRATPRPGRKFGPMTPLLSAVRFHSVLDDSPQSATSQVTQTSSRLHRPFALRCTRRMRHRPRRTRLTGDRRRRPRLDRGRPDRPHGLRQAVRASRHERRIARSAAGALPAAGLSWNRRFRGERRFRRERRPPHVRICGGHQSTTLPSP